MTARHEAARPLEPTPGGFAPSVAGRIKRLALATRPAFLTASILPVLVGSAWGFRTSGEFDALSFVLALLATVCVHAASNVLNDVGDEANGTDGANTERIFPYTGGSRFIQNGVMNQQEMKAWGYGLLLFALLPGAALIWMHGVTVLVFGLIGVGLGVLYSAPGVQLAARGLGESAVAIAFGVLPVIGAAWLQSGVVDGASLLIAVPVALWIAAILLVNEVPDVRADQAAGKRTLVVRWGVERTRSIYLFVQLLAIAAFIGAGVAGLIPWWAGLFALLLTPQVLAASRAICDVRSNRAQLTSAIEKTLALHTIGGLLLVVAILIAAFF